jgi:hypothetical protein
MKKILSYINHGNDYVECNISDDISHPCIIYEYYVDKNGYEILHGKYSEYLYGKYKYITCSYYNGILHGQYIEYNNTGPVKQSMYKMGKLHGMYTRHVYTYDTRYMYTYTYINGIKHGTYTITTYNSTDSPKRFMLFKGNYKMGKLHGITRKFYDMYKVYKLLHKNYSGRSVREKHNDMKDIEDTHNYYNGVKNGKSIEYVPFMLPCKNIRNTSTHIRYICQHINIFDICNNKIYNDASRLSFKFNIKRDNYSVAILKCVYEHKCGQIHGIVKCYNGNNIEYKLYYRHNKLCKIYETEVYKYRSLLNRNLSYVDIQINCNN